MLVAPVGELPVGHGFDVHPVDLQLSRGRTIDPGDEVQQRRLSGSRRAHESKEFSPRDVEGAVLQSHHLLIVTLVNLAQIRNAYQRFCHSASSLMDWESTRRHENHQGDGTRILTDSTD